MQNEPIKDIVQNTLGREGRLTKELKKQSARMPTSFFLALAGGAVALSLGLAVSQRRTGWANFVGEWVPSILLLGLYSKIVKMEAAGKIGKDESAYH